MVRSIASHAKASVRGALVAVLVLVVALLPTAEGQAKPARDAELVVMTQNVYLGSSLTPALAATTPAELVTATAQIYATVQYTDFAARAEAIADQIQGTAPDLVGLQEVAIWTTVGPTAPQGYDFLAILETALVARELNYAVASVADNAQIGPVPLALPGCVQPGPTITCAVQFNDRDVILVNQDTPGLEWADPQSGRYEAQAAFASPVGPISFDRGWASIDARLHGQPFTFVNTHLEVEDFAEVQQAQTAEFLSGPARGGTVIAVGDFNSAADGSTTTSYSQLTAPGRFRDAWDDAVTGAGPTCCQASNTPPLAPGALNNPTSTLETRIDLVLGRGAARPIRTQTQVVGADPFQAAPPFWPSDHAGVVATFRLR